jgi:hypothetical protein
VIPFLAHTAAATDRRLIVEMHTPTIEDMVSMLSMKFATRYTAMSLNKVKSACAYAFGDVRRAEGRLNSMIFRKKKQSLWT